MSSSLLKLPREIRDLIIDLVVTDRRQPPRDSRDVPESSRRTIQTWEYRSWVGLQDILFETDQPHASASGLLCASQQLNRETLESLDRRPQAERAYSLDLMFVAERELWPTWTYVPVQSRSIDQLDVDIRIVGAMENFGGGYGRPGSTIWNPGCGAPPAVVWPFHAMLEHVLHHGWSLPSPSDTERFDMVHKPEQEHSGLIVKRLVLCSSTTAPEANLAGPSEQVAWFRSRNGRNYDEEPLGDMHRKIVRPEWLAEYLIDYLELLLGMSYDMGEYGDMVYQWVGEIEVRNGERMRKVIDIGKKLVDLEYADHSRNSPEQFNTWKSKTVQWRTARGLAVGPSPTAGPTTSV